MRRIFICGLVVTGLLSVVGHAQQFGPRSVYVRPIVRVWDFPAGSGAKEILEAAEKVASAHDLSVSEVAGQDSVVRLLNRKRISGKQFDEYCEYPVRNLENWHPMNTFARDFIRSRRERWGHRWVASVVLDLHLPSDPNQGLRIVSHCRFYLPERGELPTTSLAVFEERPLLDLAGVLGYSGAVTVADLPDVKPDLDGIEFFSVIQETCGETGVYVDVDTGEVSCTPPQRAAVMKASPAPADETDGSALPVLAEQPTQTGTFPIRIEKTELTLNAEVLYGEMDPSASQSVLPLKMKSCGAPLSSASVVEVNGKRIEDIHLLLGPRTESGGCEEARATLELQAIAPRLAEGRNLFVVKAGDLTAEVALNVQ